jgi:hypothetical protein
MIWSLVSTKAPVGEFKQLIKRVAGAVGAVNEAREMTSRVMLERTNRTGIDWHYHCARQALSGLADPSLQGPRPTFSRSAKG